MGADDSREPGIYAVDANGKVAVGPWPVTFASDDRIVIVGEGGENSSAGTLARLTCSSLH